MRVAHSHRSLIVLAALCLSACGAGTPAGTPVPQSTPETAETTVPEPAKPSKPAAGEDDGWVGEKAAKGKDIATDETAPAAPAEPTAANGKVAETRTMDVIRKLVMDNRKAARKCYDDARKDLKDLQGDLVIHFVLDPEGKVKLAELNQERSTLKAPPVVECVLGVIRGIHFPKSSRAMETSTNYPFNFTP